MAEIAPRSIAVNERIDTLDLLRGIAICGILLMNIPDMGMLWEVTRPAYPFIWNRDWTADFIQTTLFAGSMRGLFTLLFGSGMLVMLRRTERDGIAAPMDVFLRRCIALMFLGVVQFAVFLWPGEILWNYGFTGFFLITFRKAKVKTLWIVSITILILFSLVGSGQAFGIQAQQRAAAEAHKAQAQHKVLTKEQQDALESEKKMNERRNPPKEKIDKEIKDRTHFPSVLAWSAKEWVEFNMGNFAWFGPLESFIFMLIGMAMFRMKILTGERTMGFYVKMAVIGYGIGFPIRAIVALMAFRMGNGLDFTTILLNGLCYEPARFFVTVGHVGFICALFKAGALGRAWPARALGRMALTTYSLQSILTSILFYGFGMVTKFGFAALMGISVAIWVLTGIFAVLWLQRFQQGPAEWCLRRMAYGKGAAAPGAQPGPDGTLATA